MKSYIFLIALIFGFIVCKMAYAQSNPSMTSLQLKYLYEQESVSNSQISTDQSGYSQDDAIIAQRQADEVSLNSDINSQTTEVQVIQASITNLCFASAASCTLNTDCCSDNCQSNSTCQ